jgi:hypothetical protein
MISLIKTQFLIVLALGTFSLCAQPFYVRLKSVDREYLPDYIEKVVEVQQTDSCRIERIQIFKEWGKTIDSTEWNYCIKDNEVQISRNNNIVHSFSLKEGESEGRLSLVKTKLIIQFVKDTLNNTQSYWLISDKMDKRYTLKYDDVRKQILASTEPFSQRYLMSGFLFDEIPKNLSGKPLIGFNDALLKPGDSLQVLYFSETKGAKKMLQLNTYHVTAIDETAEFPTWQIASEIYDAEKEITIQQDTILMTKMPDGLMLGNNMALPYNYLKEGMYRIDPREEIWRLHILPLIDVEKPNIELFYDTTISIGNTSAKAYRYWNSVLPYRLSWVYDFPLPVQEFEGIRAEPVFVKANGIIYGKSLRLKAANLPALQYFDEQKTALLFRFHVAKKGNYRIRLFDASQQEVNLEKKDFKLKGGTETMSISAPNKQPDANYLVKWYALNGDKEVLLKEFIFHSRYFN